MTELEKIIEEWITTFHRKIAPFGKAGTNKEFQKICEDFEKFSLKIRKWLKKREPQT